LNGAYILVHAHDMAVLLGDYKVLGLKTINYIAPLDASKEASLEKTDRQVVTLLRIVTRHKMVITR
jgi:hypothetical protein